MKNKFIKRRFIVDDNILNNYYIKNAKYLYESDYIFNGKFEQFKALATKIEGVCDKFNKVFYRCLGCCEKEIKKGYTLGYFSKIKKFKHNIKIKVRTYITIRLGSGEIGDMYDYETYFIINYDKDINQDSFNKYFFYDSEDIKGKSGIEKDFNLNEKESFDIFKWTSNTMNKQHYLCEKIFKEIAFNIFKKKIKRRFNYE